MSVYQITRNQYLYNIQSYDTFNSGIKTAVHDTTNKFKRKLQVGENVFTRVVNYATSLIYKE